jgi:hypothetical protein
MGKRRKTRRNKIIGKRRRIRRTRKRRGRRRTQPKNQVWEPGCDKGRA